VHFSEIIKVQVGFEAEGQDQRGDDGTTLARDSSSQ